MAKSGLWSGVMDPAEYIDLTVSLLQYGGIGGIVAIAAIGWHEWWSGSVR